ncbi:MAG: segregation and condensation protein A [Planctomycetia bacterium]
MSATPFTIRLERVFQGPMDLLLHLVREQEVEIHEIEISRVIDGYLEYVRNLRDLDIEVAGDFLVMAATLMSIKSRSLLPNEEIDLQKELDPRDELIQRLIEYRRFKEASDELGERYEIRNRSFPRGNLGAEEPTVEPELDLGELTSWDLLAAFSRLMRETLGNRPHQVVRDSRPLRFYVRTMAHTLRGRNATSLRDLVLAIDKQPSRESLIGSFCALLELAKLGLITVAQTRVQGEIEVCLRPEHAEDVDAVIENSVLDDELPPPSEQGAAGQEAQPQASAPAPSDEQPA